MTASPSSLRASLRDGPGSAGFKGPSPPAADVDEARVEATLEKLVAWGLVEEVGGDLRPTRRWNAKLQAAAEKLNLLAAKGQPPAGNPLVVAVQQALAAENRALDDTDLKEAVELLVMLELSRMKVAKRIQLGFPDVRFPGDVDDAGSGVDFHPQAP